MVHITRRAFLQSLCASTAAVSLVPHPLLAAGSGIRKRTVPATGEELAVLGMGTFRTFDAGEDAAMRARLARVLQAFFDHGGELVDTSPLYDSSEEVTGDLLLQQVDTGDSLFAATKIFTEGKQAGIRQMQDSMAKLNVGVMDLMQIHNLVDWQTHLKTLYEWKEQGRVRYIGIATSRGRDHDEFVGIMKRENLDFVQFSYNIVHRHAEEEIFPVAADRGIATLVNMPFQRGELFHKVRNRPLPDWATDIDCNSWAQVFLKYIISHPGVTCTIPATSSVDHMIDNRGAGYGALPDTAMRRRMEREFAGLA